MASEIILERLSTDSEAYGFCEALYNRSFPENERRDFYELAARNNDTQQSFLIRRGNEMVGYLARLNSSRYSHIIYFAVEESLQGQGIGSQVLELLNKTPPLLPLIADLELPEEGSENYEQRRQRMRFYLRARFTESPVRYRWRDVDWVILIRGGTITDRQFKDFWDEVMPRISANSTDRVMSQYERMKAGLLYDPADAEIVEMQAAYQDRLWEFNRLRPSDIAEKTRYMKEVFAECGENNYIELPFHANWGGHHVHFGSGIYANSNLTLVDDGHIYIGDCVMFGPNVTIATANHPIDAELRRKALQYNKDVFIGENTWIGANTVIVPGVHIGRDTVIGAGSVVTKDIPEHVVAVGNPCRVLREIGEHDRQFFYRDEEIDWENLL